MSVLADTTLLRDGVPGIALESDLLRLTVFPEAGGKILDLVHRPTGTNLLWQNPRVPLRRTYPGAAFDDVWCGGWDELFPTDPPCELDGETYHDHGDLWTGPWDWSLERDDGEEATLRLRRFSVSLPCLVEKWITVRRESASVRFRHRLSNVGTRPISFVWNLHVAHAIEPGSRVHLPTDAVGVEPPYWGRAGAGTRELAWPDALSVLPGPELGATEWLFARGLDEGRCAVTHPSSGVGVELAFDPEVFRTVWLWGVFGGWRGHYLLLTEPCTSPPGSLAHNVARGTAASLAAGGVLETEVVATVLDGPAAARGAEAREGAAA